MGTKGKGKTEKKNIAGTAKTFDINVPCFVMSRVVELTLFITIESDFDGEFLHFCFSTFRFILFIYS